MRNAENEKKEATKNKTDLFRFATLRSPQLISKRRRELGFVEHPDHSGSYFLKEIISEQDPDAARQRLASLIPGFTPFASVEEVKNFAGSLWAFSMWLGKHKSELHATTDLAPQVQGANALSASDHLRVWDNVFFDILTQSNGHVRQACLQLLVSTHFLKHYNDHRQDTKQLKRIANSKVIVPTAFSVKAQALPTSGGTTVVASRAARDNSIARQAAQNQKLLAGEEIKILEGFQEELGNLRERHRGEMETALDKASAEYDKKAETILKKPNAKAKERLRSATQADDEQQESSLDDMLPPFQFDFPKPLSRKYTSRKLSYAARHFIREHQLEEASVALAIQVVDEKIQNQKSVAERMVPSVPKSVLRNGVMIRQSNTYVPTYTLSTRVLPTSQGHSVEVLLSFQAGYANSFLNDADLTVYLGNNPMQSYPVAFQDIVIIPSSQANTLFARLTVIPVTQTELTQGLFITLSGTMELDSGRRYALSSKKTSIHRAITSIAEEIDTEKGEDENPVIHYGVNRIGVADYRRVEQELCCYIPGEVSHIENILAREYKEKATRQLVRSEDIYESTTEHEVEELNDTTTSTKFEMSSEIAQVINRDRSSNIGFSTGASGSYFGMTFQASANGDFSFAQSSSDSNTIARTYAEDVTRRALERIVQRTTVKRTSKILREFEDNNKHGYDNRNGEQHVTGVFRWLDKVYKNRIVNYGKRLIYEFMIPEPGRFYKELILIEAQETGDDGMGPGTTLVAPTHPKDLDVPINGPADITRGNYQSLIAEYGVTAASPLPATQPLQNQSYIRIHSPAERRQDTTTSFQQTALTVPADYECTTLVHDIELVIHRQLATDHHWYLEVTTDSMESFQRPPTYGSLNTTHTRSYTHSNLAITMPITPTFRCKRLERVKLTLSGTLTLKSSVFQQWQQSVYDDVMSAYQQQLDAYNQAMNPGNGSGTQPEPEEDTVMQTNPLYAKQYILKELKRICIDMMLRPFGVHIGRDFYEDAGCGVVKPKLGAELDSYSRMVKFFEQAFDWQLLAQVFYPYYWAKQCDWKTLFQTQDAADHVLQEFLQSGMGRILVPVREGFEDAVTYFMETGEIWHGTGLVLDTDDELYLSIVDEVTHLDGEVEEEWETIVPTSLTLVQGGSALLDESGLPCCEKEEAPTIKPDKYMLHLGENAG